MAKRTNYIPTNPDMAAILRAYITDDMDYQERYAFETAVRLLDHRCMNCKYHNDPKILIKAKNELITGWRCTNSSSVMKYKITRDFLTCDKWEIEDVKDWLKRHEVDNGKVEKSEKHSSESSDEA